MMRKEVLICILLVISPAFGAPVRDEVSQEVDDQENVFSIISETEEKTGPEKSDAAPLQKQEVRETKKNKKKVDTPEKMLEDLMDYGYEDRDDVYKLRYSIDDGTSKRFRYEERTPEGMIEGEFGFQNGNAVFRGVRYTAEPGVHPKLLYQALVKFLSL